MAGRGMERKISAASSRAHTRRANKNFSFPLSRGVLKTLLVISVVVFLAWAYQAIQPPPPKICGSSDGPPITSSRIRLRNGRYVAYKEHGIARNNAKYKIVYVHGFYSCRHDAAIAKTLSQDVAEELGIYIVSFDRSGYGESDPNPKRTLKSLAFDIEELADQLELGSRFYVVGFSMGGQVVWTCLKHIPHRLAGAALLAPVINYWWPGFPANLSKEAYYLQPTQDQWTLRVAHYLPWLTHWWNTQKWFPASSVAAGDAKSFSRDDLEIFPKYSHIVELKPHARQQGEYESLHRDMMIGFGSWEFDPMDLENPFPNNEGSVHLWQGDEDKMVPVILQSYIAQKLPWIHYHEIPDVGHMFPYRDGMGNVILKELLVGKSS